MIEAINLTARRGRRTVLHAVGFDVRPGQVTGVLGAKGAGKTTLLRRMVQLERGGGRTLFDGRQYRALRHPIREVGVVFGPYCGAAERTIRSHLLLVLSTDRRAVRRPSAVMTAGSPELKAPTRFSRRRGRVGDRIDAALDIAGLATAGATKLGDLSEDMATRLAIAAALLGDPKVLFLDSPDRTLEPGGAAWLGTLLRAFTAQGRAALITGDSVETLTAMADRLLLLDTGRLVGARTAEEVLRTPGGTTVFVRSPQVVRFAVLLAEAGARIAPGDGAGVEVRGLDRARVGDLAFRHHIPLHELAERFTGTDPADIVLAACSGQPVCVPAQGTSNVRLVNTLPGTLGAAGELPDVRLIDPPVLTVPTAASGDQGRTGEDAR